MLLLLELVFPIIHENEKVVKTSNVISNIDSINNVLESLETLAKLDNLESLRTSINLTLLSQFSLGLLANELLLNLNLLLNNLVDLFVSTFSKLLYDFLSSLLFIIFIFEFMFYLILLR